MFKLQIPSFRPAQAGACFIVEIRQPDRSVGHRCFCWKCMFDSGETESFTKLRVSCVFCRSVHAWLFYFFLFMLLNVSFFFCFIQKYQLKRARKCPLLSELHIRWEEGCVRWEGIRSGYSKTRQLISDSRHRGSLSLTPHSWVSCSDGQKREAGWWACKDFHWFFCVYPFLCAISRSSLWSRQGSFVCNKWKLTESCLGKAGEMGG